jgi:hypothetical protein
MLFLLVHFLQVYFLFFMLILASSFKFQNIISFFSQVFFQEFCVLFLFKVQELTSIAQAQKVSC